MITGQSVLKLRGMMEDYWPNFFNFTNTFHIYNFHILWCPIGPVSNYYSFPAINIKIIL